MKLRINKACDLSSISVLPPRRTGSMMSSQGASQRRSQSQQSFSQTTSQSQLSQFDESLICDQRLGSNDSSSKTVPLLPSTSSGIRDESQMQLSRVAPNTVPRWNSSSARDVRCQASEEIDQRLRHLETLLSRMGMIIDSVQSDVMQISRAVKEVLLETDGIRQKMITTENSLQQILKGEENVKEFFDGSLKNISSELTKNSNSNKLNEISSQISSIPDQILANFSKLHSQIVRLFSRETEIIVSNVKSFSSRHRNPNQSPISRTGDDSSLVKVVKPVRKLSDTNLVEPISRPPAMNIEADKVKLLQPKPTSIHQNTRPKMEETSVRQKKNNIINLDSDEENDISASASCVILKKETDDKESYWMKEAKEDSLRILREARKRKRRQMRNSVRHDA
ncbi:putative recombination initiation defects 3 [Carex rostrata]